MTYTEAREYLLKQAKALGVDAEVIASENRTLTLEAFENKLSSTTQAQQGGVGLRVIVNGKTGYASSEERSREALDWALTEAKENAELQDSGEGFLPTGKALGYSDLLSEGLSAPLAEKAEAALEFEATLRKDEQLKQVIRTGYTESETQFSLSSTAGAEGGYRSGHAVAFGMFIMEKGESLKQGFEAQVEHDFHSLEPGKTALDALGKTRRLLGAKPLPSGRYTGYIEPKAFCDLLGLLTFMLSGRALVEGKSRLEGKLGSKIAPELFTLIDDATLKDGLNSHPFDSEGIPTRKLALIENGVLKSFMHNSATAAKTGQELTGHASRSYKGTLDVGSSNLYVEPGEGVSLQDGVLVTQLRGLHAGANPITGDISLQALGVRYEGGEVAHPVENFVVSGNLLELLNRITGLGRDLEWHQSKAAPIAEIQDVSFGGS